MASQLKVLPDVCGDVGYVSREEEEVLGRMRTLRHQAEEIRSRLEGDDGDVEERQAWEQELQNLRRQWQDLDQELKGANRRKLIRLGHLEPESSQEKK